MAASTLGVEEPVMVAWYDKKGARMSPSVIGTDVNAKWHDYGESHGGKVEVDVNGDYDFIFGDASSFDEIGTSPLVNLRDQAGNEYFARSTHCAIRSIQAKRPASSWKG